MRVAVDSRPDVVLQLMLSEWQMDRPKLLISVHGGSENLVLPPKVNQAFSKGLLTAALSTEAWILTDGINTGTRRGTTKLYMMFVVLPIFLFRFLLLRRWFSRFLSCH